MIIRKLYRIESAHIVIDAVSKRCSHSTHGHSGVIEVFLKSNHLDKAGMIYDFGAFKKTIGSFIDMFDHSTHLWIKDNDKRIAFFKEMNERWIELPCNPTAENYCILLKDCINEILEMSQYNNNEGYVRCVGVRYHETTTGYAESEESDSKTYSIRDIRFSEATMEEASEELREICKQILMMGVEE